MAEQFTNAGVSILTLPLMVTDLTMKVQNPAVFPLIPQFRLLIDNELVFVTAVAGDVYTIIRGIEDTDAADHANFSNVFLPITAGFLQSLVGPYGSFVFEFDNTPSALPAGLSAWVRSPYVAVIIGGTILLDQTGDISIEVRKCTYADFDAGVTHPGPSDKISGSNPLIVSSDVKSQDQILTGWTTEVGENDIIQVVLSSVSGAQQAFIMVDFAKA